MRDNTKDLKDVGLKVTQPRSKILEIFQLHPNEHYSADEVHLKLHKTTKAIGLATVYRVLTQLELAGLIQKNHFNNSQSTYEISKEHHDHLICIKCGKIVEFMSSDIENFQEKVSTKYNFILKSHVMTLFGECTDGNCSGNNKKQKR